MSMYIYLHRMKARRVTVVTVLVRKIHRHVYDAEQSNKT
jgi:hypothetical protein